jgi:hypothetical protein
MRRQALALLTTLATGFGGTAGAVAQEPAGVEAVLVP